MTSTRFLPFSHFKHLATICKLNGGKYGNEDLSKVYIVYRNRCAYAVATDGHTMAIYAINREMQTDESGCYALNWEHVETLASIKSKLHTIYIDNNSDRVTLNFAHYTCEAVKRDTFFPCNVIDRIAVNSKDCELMPSPMLAILNPKMLAHIFPDKTSTLLFFQCKEAPESFQIAWSADLPEYLGIVMPIPANEHQIAQHRDKIRGFFE